MFLKKVEKQIQELDDVNNLDKERYYDEKYIRYTEEKYIKDKEKMTNR